MYQVSNSSNHDAGFPFRFAITRSFVRPFRQDRRAGRGRVPVFAPSG
jgi:hypothetical protein